MLALVAAVLFLIAFVVELVGTSSLVVLLLLAGLFFLALGASEMVRDRVGGRRRA